MINHIFSMGYHHIFSKIPTRLQPFSIVFISAPVSACLRTSSGAEGSCSSHTMSFTKDAIAPSSHEYRRDVSRVVSDVSTVSIARSEESNRRRSVFQNVSECFRTPYDLWRNWVQCKDQFLHDHSCQRSAMFHPPIGQQKPKTLSMQKDS